jgi:serine phosphatase RsbU (regulator of sigma subunit)
VYFFNHADYPRAAEEVKSLLEAARNAKNIKYEITALYLISDIYFFLADYNKAIEALQTIQKHLAAGIKHDKVKESFLLGKLGKYYEVQRNYERSKSIYHNSLIASVSEKNQFSEAFAYSNLANVYALLNDFDSSLYFHHKCIELRETDSVLAKSLPFSYNDIALVLDTLGKHQEAFKYFQKAYLILDAEKEPWAKCVIACNYSRAFLRQKKYAEAQKIAQEALDLGMKTGAKDGIRLAHNVLYIIANEQKDYKTALFHYIRERVYTDSIAEANKASELAKLEGNFELAEKEKQNEILKEKNEKQGAIITAFAVDTILALLIIFILWRNNKKKQRNNLLLQQQKEEITKQSEEIALIAENLKAAYAKLDAKNADTLASIQYAKRIQQNMLPAETVFKSIFPESFIFFRPKDIVSGDFYKVSSTEKGDLLIVADCTGHGVPGALMSMIGINVLNEIISRNGNHNPALILNLLNEHITEIFNREDRISTDGMDISLLFFERDNSGFCYAGAMNDALLITFEEEKPEERHFMELKADKLPVGSRYAKGKEYAQAQFSFKDFIENTTGGNLVFNFFLYSDGYKDQFGGTLNKKFMSKKFKNLLSEIARNSSEEQKIVLENEFDAWKSNNEQTDDVLVIAVRKTVKLSDVEIFRQL